MVFKCKMCGGDIVPINGKNIAQCSYCKSTMTLPNLENEKIVNLYNRANDFRIANEFDKASFVYENILEIDNSQAEAHWGLLLCKYGVEYVDDPKTGTKIPTCHRTVTTSILKDQEFKIIKENSYGEALELYTKEAKKIDEIQKGILEISTKEDAYDVFICYKETDENGERTHDSVIAQDIYEKLTSKNYKVFFARITLENKLGSEYEPYIYSALSSSKVMLVVGTTEENFNAVWVKNEWSRYLEMMKEDKSKTLIPVYSKIDAYKLPEEFARFQAQSMDKIGAMQDLTHGIQKLIDESKNKKVSDTDVERVKKALDEASNLGNGRYEVVVMKQRASIWYYIFILASIIGYVFLRLINLEKRTLDSVYASGTSLSIYNFTKLLSNSSFVLCGLSSVLVVIALVMPLLGRKIYRKSKSVMFIAILIEFINLGTFFRWGYIDIFIFPYLIPFVFLGIKPKWYIDSSSKLVMDKDGKDNVQTANEELIKNFKEKDKEKVSEKYIFLIIILIIIIGAGIVYNISLPNSNGRNEMVDQIEITIEDTPIYLQFEISGSYGSATRTSKYIVATAQKGEYYNILDEVKLKDTTYAYKIRTEKGIEGYILRTNAMLIEGIPNDI